MKPERLTGMDLVRKTQEESARKLAEQYERDGRHLLNLARDARQSLGMPEPIPQARDLKLALDLGQLALLSKKGIDVSEILLGLASILDGSKVASPEGLVEVPKLPDEDALRAAFSASVIWETS